MSHVDFNSPSDNPAVFWNFSLDGLALDVLANSKAMTENATGVNEKGWYFGYSQGTIQALIALAKYETELSKYLERVVLLAPCFGYSGGETKASTTKSNIYAAGYLKDELAKIGIYATGTSTWTDDIKKICDNLSEEVCKWATDAPKDMANSMKMDDH